MKRKIFATVMALVLCAATLVGCGSSADSSAKGSSEEPTASPEVVVEETEEAPTASPEPSNNIEANIQKDTNELTEDETEQVPEEESISVEEEVVPETGEAEGIIILQNYFYHADDGVSNIFVYSVSNVNPTTGTSKQIAEFSIRRPYNMTSEEFYYLVPAIGLNNRFGYDRRYFSSDFSKIAITKVFNDKNESHAGWLDQSGNFFDATEALNEQSSDFGDPVTYNAIGFTEDDLFVYSDNPTPSYMHWDNDNFRYADLSLTSSQEGNPLEGICQIIDSNNRFYCISDRVSDKIFIADGYEGDFRGSVIYDSGSHESKKYIPSESRSNWSGVCSPDGSQIAFMSMPSTGNGNPEIFIIPFEGGEPEKLNCDIVFSNDENTGLSSILEWK